MCDIERHVNVYTSWKIQDHLCSNIVPLVPVIVTSGAPVGIHVVKVCTRQWNKDHGKRCISKLIFNRESSPR